MLSEEEAYTKFMAIGLAATVKKTFRNNLFCIHTQQTINKSTRTAFNMYCFLIGQF